MAQPGPAPPGTRFPPGALRSLIRIDLGTCRSALGEGAGISGPSHLLYQKGSLEREAWQEAVEGPHHCRDLDGEEGRGQ